jgi:uridine kinase
MERTITILCKNNGESIDIPLGSTLTEAYEALGLDMPHGAACAEVNNTVENMNYVLFSNSDIKFLDITTPSGMRTYTRSLFFVLSKAVADSFPNVQVRIDTPVSNGYYCRLLQEGDITDDEVKALEKRMRGIIEADIPFRRIKAHTDDVVKRFRAQGHESKAKLIENGGSLYSYYYMLEDTMDYFYGALLPSTGCIWLFGIEKYHDGVLLRLPDPTAPDKLCPLIKQEKMFGVFQENHEIQRIIGLNTIGDMNMLISQGRVNEMINVSEALQEKKIAHIADEIASRKDVRVVLISGPSSSGKTTFSKRLSVQLLASGLKPYPISMDNYFVDRDKTPRTPSGDYDFESLHALNTELLASQLNTLIAGGEVELPKYNFQTGKSEKSGVRLRTDGNTIIVMEGIHGLNPELTAQVPEKNKFRIYVSALTSILLDDHNYIPTTDNRLLRRIVRDYKYRGYSARDTIARWPSVRAGEKKWIFPYQENADVMFNSALIFELAVLKPRVMPLLRDVDERYEEHSEAYRLMKFLSYIKSIPSEGLPPTSLLREFVGGSTFHY